MTATYREPASTTTISEDDVRTALAFLIAIEPDPLAAEDPEEYEALMEPHAEAASAAIRTIRRFAEAVRPRTLQALQNAYYGFSNDPRHLVSSEASGVVISALREAFEGVGPWRN